VTRKTVRFQIFNLQEMKDLGDKKGKRKRGDGGDDDDTEGASGVRKYLKGGNKKGGKKK
jgi:ATP-dependent RNA helicase DDX47/RRP3